MILLDTHVWVRWLAPSAHPLPARAMAAIAAASKLAVSAISCWELVQLHKRGRIELRMGADQWLAKALDGSGVECIAISREIAARAATLADIHRDPADRFIIASAVLMGIPLLTLDEAIHQYPEMAGLLA